MKPVTYSVIKSGIIGLTLPGGLNYAPWAGNAQATALMSDDDIAAVCAADGKPAQNLSPTQSRVSAKVWRSYQDSVAVIRALGREHGVSTAFVWQPVALINSSGKRPPLENLFYVYRNTVLSYHVYSWFFERTLKEDRRSDFADFSNIGSDLDGTLYTDVCHYSAAMARELAISIGDWLIGHGLIQRQGMTGSSHVRDRISVDDMTSPRPANGEMQNAWSFLSSTARRRRWWLLPFAVVIGAASIAAGWRSRLRRGDPPARKVDVESPSDSDDMYPIW